MNQPTKETIEVTIFGRTYPMVATKDPEYIHQLAKNVDRKMKEIADKIPDASTAGVAVMACLNFVDDYLALKSQTENALQGLDKRLSNLVQEIDAKIESDIVHTP